MLRAGSHMSLRGSHMEAEGIDRIPSAWIVYVAADL